MMRSMFSGVSGLRVHQTKMDVIANNIANVNTNGFKSSRVTFAEVFSQTVSGASAADQDNIRGGINPMQIGLGTSVAAIDKVMTTGAAQRTDRPFDVMIEGDSFFIVGDASGNYFTRAGAFTRDAAGNLTNNGMMVMGWDSYQDKDGKWLINKGTVKPITVGGGNKDYVVPTATTSISTGDNLSATKDNGEKIGSMEFFDSVGNLYSIDVQYKYNGTNWDYNFGDRAYLNGDKKNPLAIAVDSSGNITFSAPPTPPTLSGSAVNFLPAGKLAFNTSGTLSGVAKGSGAVSLAATGFDVTITVAGATATPPATALTPNATFGTPTATLGTGTISLDFKDLTGFPADPSNAKATMNNGSKAGTLNGMSIGTDGLIWGSYSNGQKRLLGQVAVANFANPAGLESVGNNLYAATANSGRFDGIGEEIASSGGKIRGGVLEMSNVDLSSEFTEMITTQRGFQANSRIITTSDDMLQELVNLKR